MKKIVFLSGESRLMGGGEFSLIDVVEKISSNYKIFCVCKKRGDLANILKKYAIKVLYCDLSWSTKLKDIFSNYKRLFYLYLKLKKISPHLVYANSSCINRFATRLSKRLNIPIITYVHDIFIKSKSPKDRFNFKNSSQIIACSIAVVNLIIEYNKNVSLVYNGVDPKKFHPSLKHKNDNFLIGNVGTIAYKKGYFEFIKVADKIAKKIPRSKFLIIGETKPTETHILEELKKEIEKHNLESRFIFTGFVDNIAEKIANLDILLFPSHCEAFGRVIIEAFACKTPVISTYSGGPTEIIKDGETGFLFEIDDIEGMAKTIINLHRDKSLQKYITENAYKKFLKNFTVDIMVRQIKSIIDKTAVVPER